MMLIGQQASHITMCSIRVDGRLLLPEISNGCPVLYDDERISPEFQRYDWTILLVPFGQSVQPLEPISRSEVHHKEGVKPSRQLPNLLPFSLGCWYLQHVSEYRDRGWTRRESCLPPTNPKEAVQGDREERYKDKNVQHGCWEREHNWRGLEL
jgi:hypothetical protein